MKSFLSFNLKFFILMSVLFHFGYSEAKQDDPNILEVIDFCEEVAKVEVISENNCPQALEGIKTWLVDIVENESMSKSLAKDYAKSRLALCKAVLEQCKKNSSEGRQEKSVSTAGGIKSVDSSLDPKTLMGNRIGQVWDKCGDYRKIAELSQISNCKKLVQDIDKKQDELVELNKRLLSDQNPKFPKYKTKSAEIEKSCDSLGVEVKRLCRNPKELAKEKFDALIKASLKACSDRYELIAKSSAEVDVNEKRRCLNEVVDAQKEVKALIERHSPPTNASVLLLGLGLPPLVKKCKGVCEANYGEFADLKVCKEVSHSKEDMKCDQFDQKGKELGKVNDKINKHVKAIGKLERSAKTFNAIDCKSDRVQQTNFGRCKVNGKFNVECCNKAKRGNVKAVGRKIRKTRKRLSKLTKEQAAIWTDILKLGPEVSARICLGCKVSESISTVVNDPTGVLAGLSDRLSTEDSMEGLKGEFCSVAYQDPNVFMNPNTNEEVAKCLRLSARVLSSYEGETLKIIEIVKSKTRVDKRLKKEYANGLRKCLGKYSKDEFFKSSRESLYFFLDLLSQLKPKDDKLKEDAEKWKDKVIVEFLRRGKEGSLPTCNDVELQLADVMQRDKGKYQEYFDYEKVFRPVVVEYKDFLRKHRRQTGCTYTGQKALQVD